MPLHLKRHRKRQPPRPRADDGPGYIYVFCDHKRPEVVKIGWSRNPQKRAHMLSGDIFGLAKRKWYCIHGVQVSARVAAEKRAHDMLKSYRIPGPGELFSICPAAALCVLWIVSATEPLSAVAQAVARLQAMEWRNV